MKRTGFRLRRSVGAIALTLVCAVGLSACGGFDSAASGEHLIRDYINKFGQKRISLKSVSCPGGVKQKVGGTYDCNVVLHDSATNKDHPGTITIHMAAGNKVEITGGHDLQLR